MAVVVGVARADVQLVERTVELGPREVVDERGCGERRK
jgi:hypothetical protein